MSSWTVIPKLIQRCQTTFDCRPLAQAFQGRSVKSWAKLNLNPTDNYTNLCQAQGSHNGHWPEPFLSAVFQELGGVIYFWVELFVFGCVTQCWLQYACRDLARRHTVHTGQLTTIQQFYEDCSISYGFDSKVVSEYRTVKVLLAQRDREKLRKSLVRITGVLLENRSPHPSSTVTECYLYTKLLGGNEFRNS